MESIATRPQAISNLSDDELMRRLISFTGSLRRVEALVVAHIAEVDRRRLYESRACSSMHAYCTKVLHFSEHAAYMRIAVARASRRFPVLLEMLEDGRLHVSTIAKLVSYLTERNCEAVLNRAIHRTKREVEELVAELSPKADVAPSIRKAPSPKRQCANSLEFQLGPGQVVDGANQLFGGRTQSETAAAPSVAIQHAQRARIEASAPERYYVRFTASTELRDKLERLEALMKASLPEADMADFIEVAVTEKLERLEAARYGTTKRRRARTAEGAESSPPSRGRYVPAAVRRLVYMRDGGQCTYVASDGRRCSETRRLQFHHRNTPFARGPDHRPENLSLACRAHNLHLAELDYGKDFMARYRRSDDGVREARPGYFGAGRCWERADAFVAGRDTSSVVYKKGLRTRTPS